MSSLKIERVLQDTMRFSSDFTVDILTDCLQYSSKFADKNQDLFVSASQFLFLIVLPSNAYDFFFEPLNMSNVFLNQNLQRVNEFF